MCCLAPPAAANRDAFAALTCPPFTLSLLLSARPSPLPLQCLRTPPDIPFLHPGSYLTHEASGLDEHGEVQEAFLNGNDASQGKKEYLL